MLFFLLCLIFHARCFSWSFNCCKLFATSPNFPSPAVQSASIPERRGLQPVAGPICSQNPKMQAAPVGSWRPHHLCLCVQELPDTQPGEHRLPAASCSSLVPKLWLLHPWQHVLQRGMEILHHWKMPRQQGSSAQARTKGSGDTQSQDELDCPSRAPFSPPQEVY